MDIHPQYWQAFFFADSVFEYASVIRPLLVVNFNPINNM